MSKYSVLLATVTMTIAAFCAQAARHPFVGATSQQSGKKNPAIRIIEASFGDQLAHKTCTPDMSICKGLAVCKFTVGDMCTVDSKVKNLEVTWDCGDATDKKVRAAAKDTEISLSCGK